MTSPEDATVLERLLSNLEDGALAEDERTQLNDLLRREPAAVDSVVESLEIEGLLRWQYGVADTGRQSPLPQPHGTSAPRHRHPGAFAALAVAALVLLLAIIWFGSPQVATPERGRLAGWVMEPTGEAVVQITGDQIVEVVRGEVHFRAEDGDHPLRVETQTGSVVASTGADSDTVTEFYIGNHSTNDSGGIGMNPFTRVLVLAGAVVLGNAGGDVQGESGDLLVATDEDQAPEKLVIQANSEFAIDLYRELAAAHPDANLLLSPYSVSAALAMVAEGARGETALEIGRALRFPDAARRVGTDAQLIPWRTALIHSGMARIQGDLTAVNEAEAEIRERIVTLRTELAAANRRTQEARDADDFDRVFASQRKAGELARELNALLPKVDQFQLTIANSLWGERTFPFADDFTATLNRFYETGAVRNVDFRGAPEEARIEINDWIAQQTGGLLPEVLGPGAVSSASRMVLANAVYFHGQWREPFDPDQTVEKPFTLADGTTIDFPMMHDTKNNARYGAVSGDGSWFETPREVRIDGADADTRYPGEDGFQIVELPYKGGQVSMVLIAPRNADGLGSLEQLVTVPRMNDWMQQLASREVLVALPKFSFEAGYQLSPALGELGIRRAFSPEPGVADFSGMTASIEAAHQLYLSQVIHRARIQLDEKGTEAAAVTVVLTEPSAAPPPVEMRPFTPEFRADRPFLYLIRDNQSGTILFLGRTLKPEA